MYKIVIIYCVPFGPIKRWSSELYKSILINLLIFIGKIELVAVKAFSLIIFRRDGKKFLWYYQIANNCKIQNYSVFLCLSISPHPFPLLISKLFKIKKEVKFLFPNVKFVKTQNLVIILFRRCLSLRSLIIC